MPRRLRQIGALVILVGALMVIDGSSVRAAPCDSMEYQNDCYAAVNGIESFCDSWCWDEYGVPANTHSGTCHWYGENTYAPDCPTEFPENCGCFKNYSGWDCDCQLV